MVKTKINQSLGKSTTLRLFFSWVLLMSVSAVFSQEIEENIEVKVDSLYREDQFYFGFTYNSLLQKPAGLNQDKFSTEISAGFLRDMPINKDRTIAIASGLGFSYNNYIQNLAISRIGEKPSYAIIDPGSAYSKNKFSQLLVDVPIEFRWRTSTYESYKFWRIYGGLKFSYLLMDRSVFTDDQGKVPVSGNKDFNKILYGAYASAGYNTINVYIYYGLTPIFKTAAIDGDKIAMKSLKIGVIFYIL
ncbi:PorT family protein [Flavobacterium acetivorans]|nr:porin family protein [Flavobacterium sp. F-29]UFH36953.1 PorT family protein [Flavobacterium sp. F-29]